MNGNCNTGANVTNIGNVQSTVIRSTSNHNLDLEQENKKRKDMEYK